MRSIANTNYIRHLISAWTKITAEKNIFQFPSAIEIINGYGQRERGALDETISQSSSGNACTDCFQTLEGHSLVLAVFLILCGTRRLVCHAQILFRTFMAHFHRCIHFYDRCATELLAKSRCFQERKFSLAYRSLRVAHKSMASRFRVSFALCTSEPVNGEPSQAF